MALMDPVQSVSSSRFLGLTVPHPVPYAPNTLVEPRTGFFLAAESERAVAGANVDRATHVNIPKISQRVILVMHAT
jgi:hypothetical protein